MCMIITSISHAMNSIQLVVLQTQQTIYTSKVKFMLRSRVGTSASEKGGPQELIYKLVFDDGFGYDMALQLLVTPGVYENECGFSLLCSVAV